MKQAIILEDLPDAQLWLSQALEQAFPGIAISRAGTLASGRQLLATISPDLCLVDLRLPDGNGIDFIHACRKQHPQCRQVVTSIFDDDEHIFPALQAGACGYLLKEEPRDVLAAALRSLDEGRSPLSATVARQLVAYFHDKSLPPSTPQPMHPGRQEALTARQQEILLALAQGMTGRDIAERLDISTHTANKHIKNIYAKLGIHSRAEATQHAIRIGLLKD